MQYDIPHLRPERISLPEQEISAIKEQSKDILREGVILLENYAQEGQERAIKGVMANVLEDEYYSYRQQGRGAVDLYADLQQVLLENSALRY